MQPARRVLEGEVLAAPDVVFSPSALSPRHLRIQYPEGGTLADLVNACVSAAQIGASLSKHIAVYINDHRIERAYWGQIRPKAGTSVFVRVELAGGGGGGKNPLRALLAIVVAVVAVAAGGWVAGLPIFVGKTAALAGWGAYAGAAATAITLMAGQALVNALIPPPSLSSSNKFGFDQQPGNPYGQITGLSNQYPQLGAPIPRIFGERRVYPMLAARPYTETLGNDQYLRMLLLVGYGPLDISDIRIGNTAITAFAGAQYEVREGWTSDLPVTLYTKNIDEEAFSILLEHSTSNVRTSEDDTLEISVDVTFYNGLAHYDSAGNRTTRTVAFTVKYSPAGAGTWSNAVWIDGSSAYGTNVNGVLTASAASNETVVRSGRFSVPSAGSYDVEIVRTTTSGGSTDVDAAYWTVLRSIRADAPVNMEGLSLIALRLKATAQLNGVPNTINCIAKSYLPVWDGDAWSYEISKNPAWAFADVFRRRGVRTVMADSRLAIDDIVDWAEACDATAPNADEPYWEVNMVAEGGSIATVANAIAAHGRAQLTMVDGKYSITRDIEQTSVIQHFSPRNTSDYRGFKAFVDVPHAFRATFINPDKDYAQDVVMVYRDGYNEDGSGGNLAASKFEALDFPSIASSTQAWREARYHFAQLLLRPEEHSFTTDIENLRCIKGDLVRFSHDVISVGLGYGRITDITTDVDDNITDITLDALVAMEDGKTYALRVAHLDGTSSIHTLVTDEGSQIDTVALATPVAAAGGPAPGDHFMFGEQDLESAPMIVKAIAPGPNLSARITLVDAQSGVYAADQGEIPPFNTYITHGLPAGQSRPSAPTITLRSDETALRRLADGTLLERIVVTLAPFTAGAEPLAFWEVEAKQSDGGEDWIRINRVPIGFGSIFIDGVVTGEDWDVRARVVADGGAPSAWTTETNHTVVGKSTAPNPPSDFTVTAFIDGVLLEFTASDSLDLAGYEIRYDGADWAGATVVDQLTSAPTYFFPIALSGAVTFRIKAVDVVGNYSTEVTADSPAANASAVVTGYLTNESHTVQADSGGTVASFSAAGGTFKVFDELADVTTSAAFEVVSETGVDVSINASTGVYTVSSMSADQGTAVFRATYGAVTIDLTYSIAKSKAGSDGGDGADAQAIRLRSDYQAFTYDADGNAYPASQSIAFDVDRQNVPSGTVSWSTSPSVTLTGSGDSRALSIANFGSNDYVTVTATLGSLTDKITIHRIRAGGNLFTITKSSNMTLTGRTLTKAGGTNGAWDEQAYSNEAYVGGAFVSFRAAQTNKNFAMSLNSDPASDAAVSGLDYAIYPQGDGTWQILESNSVVWDTGESYTTSDVFSIVYDGAYVRYYKSGALKYSSAVASGLKLSLDSSFYNTNCSVSDVAFGPVGGAGTKVETRYKRSVSPPSTPSGSDPSGWGTEVPSGSEALWSSTATKTASDAVLIGWSTPVLLTTPNWRGDYSSGTTYYIEDAVTYNGGSYKLKVSSTSGNAPSGTAESNSYWDVISAPGAAGAPGDPPSGFSATIDLTNSSSGLNLRTIADANGYTGTQDATITFRVPSGVTITGLAGAPNGGVAIDSGTWPTGSYTIALTLTVQSGGIVRGGGGQGGNGGGTSGGNGGLGGDAIYCRLNMTINFDSGSEEKGGGGGGGAAARMLDLPDIYGGDAGGGGYPNGPGGTGGSGSGGGANGGNGSSGTTSGGGAHGTGGNGTAGNGGGAASAGSDGSGASHGSGGAAGYLVRKNGNTVTVNNSSSNYAGTIS